MALDDLHYFSTFSSHLEIMAHLQTAPSHLPTRKEHLLIICGEPIQSLPLGMIISILSLILGGLRALDFLQHILAQLTNSHCPAQ